jgi:hypothetical protein
MRRCVEGPSPILALNPGPNQILAINDKIQMTNDE